MCINACWCAGRLANTDLREVMQIYSVNLVRKKKLRGNDACPKTTPTNGSAAIRNRYYNYSMLPLVFHNKGLVRRLLRPSIICFRGEATGVTFLNRAWRPSPTFSSGCEKWRRRRGWQMPLSGHDWRQRPHQFCSWLYVATTITPSRIVIDERWAPPLVYCVRT